jgi:hypothetical protein
VFVLNQQFMCVVENHDGKKKTHRCLHKCCNYMYLPLLSKLHVFKFGMV